VTFGNGERAKAMPSTNRDELLQALVAIPAGSTVSAFPPSTHLHDRVHSLGDGVYLIGTWVGVSRAAGEVPTSIIAVSWAESDHWARRVFGAPPIEVDEEPAQHRPAPSLTFLGRPAILDFTSIMTHEQTLSGPRHGPLESAEYRWTDGRFVSYIVSGVGIQYYFGRPNPRKADQPAAIAIDLPGSTHDEIVISPPGARLPWR
jgi:hypothetical protein